MQVVMVHQEGLFGPGMRYWFALRRVGSFFVSCQLMYYNFQ